MPEITTIIFDTYLHKSPKKQTDMNTHYDCTDKIHFSIKKPHITQHKTRPIPTEFGVFISHFIKFLDIITLIGFYQFLFII